MERQMKHVLRPVDHEARRLAKTLLRCARFAALGTIDVATGAPAVSRINLATAMSGAPVFLISQLSAHYAALEADCRCSLLVGEPGIGDPLAYPRMTIIGEAVRVSDTVEHQQIRHRFLLRNPKSALYVDFPDFAFWRVQIWKVSLNGGFARAYAPAPADVLLETPDIDLMSAIEADAVAHMNAEHADAVGRYALLAGAKDAEGWTLTGIDPEGVDLARGGEVVRLWFEQPLQAAAELPLQIVELAGLPMVRKL